MYVHTLSTMLANVCTLEVRIPIPLVMLMNPVRESVVVKSQAMLSPTMAR